MRLVFWLLLFLWGGEMLGREELNTFSLKNTEDVKIEIKSFESTCTEGSININVSVIGMPEYPLKFTVVKRGTNDLIAQGEYGEPRSLYAILVNRDLINAGFQIKVEDNAGKLASESSTTIQLTQIASLPKYEAPVINNSIISYNSYKLKTTGAITGTVDKGMPPFKITLIKAGNEKITSLDQISRQFSFGNLSLGTYHVEITDNCQNTIKSTNIIISDCSLPFQSRPTGTYTCQAKGTITFSLRTTPSNLTAKAISKPLNQEFRFPVSLNNQFTVSGLASGEYQVLIQGESCVFDTLITLNSPDSPMITGTEENINCSNDNIGKITLMVDGGKEPYKYKWSDNATTNQQQNRTNLPQGVYSVTVTDGDGCTATQTFTINQIPKPVLSAPAEVELKCAGDKNGKVTLVVTPNTRTYTYAWSDRDTSRIRDNLAKGEYKVKAIDKNLTTCESNELTIKVTELAPLALKLEPKDPTCPSNNNGTITANVTGGTAPYTYSWTGGKTTKEITSLIEGSYTVMVIDQNKCGPVSASTTLVAKNGPTIPDLSIKDINCSNENIGSINVTVSGAVSYSWTNAQNIVVGTAEALTYVPAGIYTLKVTDANGCIATKSDTIKQTLPPKNITFINGQVSCKGSKDGKIEFSLKAGEPAVTFRWFNGDTQNKAISNLGAGAEYGLTITNVVNKCTTSQLLKVEEPAEALKSNGIKIITRSTCNDKEDGSIEVNPSGGWPGVYTYQWFQDGKLLPDRVNKIKASSGKYKVIIQDSKACMVMDEVDLNVEGNLFYNLSPTKETYTSTISPNLMQEAWDDPALTIPLAANSDFTLFGTKEKVDTLWLLNEFAGVVLSTKKVGKTPNDTASLIIVYGADLVDRGYKLWARKQAASVSPITVQIKPDIGGRIWILEWKNAGFFNELDESGSATSAINFQLWLYEKNKNLELKFGPSTPNTLPNPTLLFNGKKGPMIALVKGYNFQTDEYKDLWYLNGAANNPTPQVLRNGQLQKFNETLDSHPASNQVYRFCTVTPVKFAPDPSPEIEIRVTPNPTYERATLNFTPLLQPAQVWVSDQLGRKVLAGQELAAGDTEITLNLQGLPKGIYLIHLNDAQRTQVQKVIKQ